MLEFAAVIPFSVLDTRPLSVSRDDCSAFLATALFVVSRLLFSLVIASFWVLMLDSVLSTRPDSV
ncbi:Uncharacterised protein [Klebsiella pneumoniae]|nr:Uncharacterised protein [Klebsiella pneumoniae]